MYTVKEVSDITGLSAHTIRFYDKEGLFPKLARDGKNRRLFSDADVSSVKTIRDLREMGFPISKIRVWITAEAENDKRAKRAIFREQMERLKSELAAASRQMELLRSKAGLSGAGAAA